MPKQKDDKMKTYQIPAVVVAIVSTDIGTWNIVFQRIDEIDDVTNPFHGQKKAAVLHATTETLNTIARKFGCTTKSQLINKQVILEMTDDNSIFEKICRIAPNQGGFRAKAQKLPRFVMAHAGKQMALGIQYI